MPPPSHMPTKRFFASPSSVPFFQQTRRLPYRYFPHISVCYNLFFSPITAPRFIVATIPHTFSASCVVFCIALYRPISLSLNTGSLSPYFAPWAQYGLSFLPVCASTASASPRVRRERTAVRPRPPWASFLVSASN